MIPFEFPQTLQWINSPPLRFQQELKGKIVILDFWTYCCINCMHVLPELKILEEKYRDKPVVFIGVHSPKFENEQQKENVSCAVKRLQISHPIVSDPNRFIWEQLGIRAWPTFVILGPHGEFLATFSGEGQGERIDKMIASSLERFKKTLDHTPLPQLTPTLTQSPLLFPGKICVGGKHLFVSDAGHHQIVQLSLNGDIEKRIGAGIPLLRDGNFASAAFKNPQGVVYHNHLLYVADTDNHALRLIDLEKECVTTLAGNGRQGRDYLGGKTGKRQELSSPWDLCLVGGFLFIAMAGTHQIWVYEIKKDVCMAFSGTGAEMLLDHKEIRQAAWAQPSGLSFGEGILFVADSESSSIRALSLTNLFVKRLAGGDPDSPRNLFVYGDRNGAGDKALLQHPMGVAWHPKLKKLIVVDSYNHRLKLLDPYDSTIVPWVGNGEPGLRDGKGEEARFYEPSGCALSADGETVFVTDTNNHAVRAIHTFTAEVRTLVR